MASDVVVYFAFVAMFVMVHAGFSVFLGFAGRVFNDSCMGTLFPAITVLGNAAFVIAYGIKVVALGDEGGATQFSFWMQRAYPVFGLALGTGAAALLLILSARPVLSHGLYFALAVAYFGLSAALSMWMVLAGPTATSAAANDVLACVALGLFALAFPVVAISERNQNWMRARLSRPIQYFQLDDFGPPVTINCRRVFILVRYQVPANLVTAWSFCQLYVSFKYFLDPVRFAADVVFVGFFPIVFSVLAAKGSLEYWLHFRIVCENARWLTFCAFPTFANSGFNAATNPLFFSFSSWAGSASADFYIASLYFLSPLALTFVITMYIFPSRAGIFFAFANSAPPEPCPDDDDDEEDIGSGAGVSGLVPTLGLLRPKEEAKKQQLPVGDVETGAARRRRRRF